MTASLGGTHSTSLHDAVTRALGARLRPMGSALSPNGLGLSDESMMSMVQLDSIISVDKGKEQVTVQAGARVSDVVEALRWYGLTLQNYASIAEQQIGGFLQVVGYLLFN